MDIKITFDVAPKLADILERICCAGMLMHKFCNCGNPEAYNEDRFGLETDAPENASDLPVETPEPSPVSKPVEPPKSEPDVKIEAPATAIDETPARETKDETPVEPSKPKRSHHKKAEKPAEPEPEKPAEPEPEKSAEPEPEKPAAPENEAKADAPEMSLDEVRAVCVQAAKAGKTKVVTDFLGAHDAQSLSKLDPKHYAELAEIVKAAL